MRVGRKPKPDKTYMAFDFTTGNAVGSFDTFEKAKEFMLLCDFHMEDAEDLVIVETDNRGMTTNSWMIEDLK